MDPAVLITIGVVALVVLPFVLAVLTFRPLIISLADRIAGKKGSTKEIKDLKQQVRLLHDEISDLRGKVMSMEDDYQFAKNLLEDMEKREHKKSE